MFSKSVVEQPLHLNSTGCVIRRTNEKGRGVYASRPISSQTLIEISPVLFFSKEEYANHGRFTVLDEYTFKWTDGRMALALGLGSLFNHSARPNVSYVLDTANESIKYTTARDIAPDEELCIFYGHKLWFDSAESLPQSDPTTVPPGELDDGWGGLSAVGEASTYPPFAGGPYSDGDSGEIIADEDLPFTRFKLPPEEEELDSIRTVEAWVVDIPDPRHITKMLKWLKQTGLETPDLGHLKRIRKQNDVATLVLATTATAPAPPSVPPDLGLPHPYTFPVPSAPALTQISWKLKSTFWPTLFTPSRKGEAEEWTRGKARWAWEAMRTTIVAAHDAHRRGELPIAAYIAAPYDPKEDLTATPELLSFTACDTRRSTAHPLRHAVINVIRQIADHRASASADSKPRSLPPTLPPLPPESTVANEERDREEARTGTNYLLTSLTVFTTHEPCIMCSMALLHSRVKEVVYLHAMPRTGGCGGAACLPTLKGINHRFGICQWKTTATARDDSLRIDDMIDA